MPPTQPAASRRAISASATGSLVDRHPRAAEIDVIGLEVLAKPGLVDVEVNEVVRVALAEQGSERRDLEPIGGQDLHLRPAYAHAPAAAADSCSRIRDRIPAWQIDRRPQTFAAAVTPLRDRGEHLDEEAFGPLLDFYAASGIDGVLMLGTTGEGIMLEPGERHRAAELAIESAGTLRVIIHCGAQTTAATMRAGGPCGAGRRGRHRRDRAAVFPAARQRSSSATSPPPPPPATRSRSTSMSSRTAAATRSRRRS